MMIKSKKGMVMYILVILGFIMALSYYFVVSFYALPSEQDGFPGEFQIKFLEEASKLEGERFFVEQAGRESAREAGISLANLGGFDGLDGGCGFVGTFNLWFNGSKWCRPPYQENFERIFERRFEEKVDLEMSYDFLAVNSSVWGAADDVLSKEIYFEEEQIGEYFMRPSFEVETGYDLGDYEEVFKRAEELVDECAGQGEECIGEKISSWDGWEIGDCTGILKEIEGKWLFCVKGENFKVFEGEDYVERQLQYKFALDLN